MLLVTIVLISHSALALGITPAKKFLDFEPNLKTTISFNIVNNEHKDLKLLIRPRGEFSEYVTLKESIVLINPDEDSKDFSFGITLPEKIEKPGSHKLEIVITEFSPELEAEDTTIITASASVVYSLIVRVPYPGKYAEAKLQVTPASINETVRFVTLIFNLGAEDIKSAKANIEVTALNKSIAELETNEIALKSKRDGKLEANWIANVNPGVYNAQAIIYYDGKEIRLEKAFEVGNLIVEIKKVEVLDFHLGDVARFDIYLENKWNQPLHDVYAEMTISKDDKEYTKFKTATADLQPLLTERIRAYWDTKGVDIGTYDLRIVVHYAGKVTEKLIKAEVSLDAIRTDLSPTGQVIIGKKSKKTRDTILTLLIIVLISANIGWFIYFRKTRKKTK